jgi:hypothetical protein
VKPLLLIVTVIGAGGPRAALPARLPNATVAVTRGAPARTLAEASNGELSVHLRPGLYTLVATLKSEPLGPPRFCEATAINVQRQRHARTRRLTLYCPTK